MTSHDNDAIAFANRFTMIDGTAIARDNARLIQTNYGRSFTIGDDDHEYDIHCDMTWFDADPECGLMRGGWVVEAQTVEHPYTRELMPCEIDEPVLTAACVRFDEETTR